MSELKIDIEDNIKIDHNKDEKTKSSPSKRSPSLIKAQKKYLEKIKREQPELYKARTKKYSYNQYLKNKNNEEYKEKNRQLQKRYYEQNKHLIAEKRKITYYKKKNNIIDSD
jgi:hypothetical protein